MIVPLNSDKYKSLFERANIFLDLKDTNEIQNLNQYYAHMKDFYDAQSDKKYQFILMPLNNVGEEDFEIDLNSRSIKVPAAFQKIGAVESDQMAEMFVFKCDRFFDQMDLTSTNIYIQWELPNKEKKATKINMIDLESEPGKIRFAWPIHKEITAEPGVVKFSVRFFSLDDSQNLVYALNTLDSQFTVKSVLVKDIIENGAVVDVTSDFQAAIKNSTNAASGIPMASQPSFGAPGLNISKDAFVIEDSYLGTDNQGAIAVHIAKLVEDTLKVRAQAYIQDSGKITYNWYKDGTLIDVQKPEFQGIYTISDEASIVDKNKPFSFNEIYYKDNSLSEKYTGISYPEDYDLYERFSVLTIEPDTGEEITGVYQVEAINTIETSIGEEKDPIITTNSIKSAQFELPEPEAIEFSDTSLYEYIDGNLTVNFESDNDVDSIITWKYTNKEYELNENGKINTEGWEDINSFSSVGYYLPTVSETLNRTTVENIPGEPFKKYADKAYIQDEAYVNGTSENSLYSIVVEWFNTEKQEWDSDPAPAANNIKLRANVSIKDPNGEGTATELYQNFSYKWYRSIDKNDIIINDKTTQEIVIDELSTASYICEVTNLINGISYSIRDGITITAD